MATGIQRVECHFSCKCLKHGCQIHVYPNNWFINMSFNKSFIDALPPVHTLPRRNSKYPNIRCGVDQAVLDLKIHGERPLGKEITANRAIG